MNQMRFLKQYRPTEGYTTLVRRGRGGIHFLELGILRLQPGGGFRRRSGKDEVVLVLLGGSATITLGQIRYEAIGRRRSVFDGQATALFIPPNHDYSVEAITPLEAILCRATGEEGGRPHLVPPEDVRVIHRGHGTFQREVHDIIDERIPARHLVVGETFNFAGCWSSYPPHKHDRMAPPEEVEMEEVYFFKLDPPQGFGLQRIYSSERGVDTALVIRDNSLVRIPWGYHPVAAAPGYRLYYLWVMAGKTRTLTPFDDPDHRWVKKG